MRIRLSLMLIVLFCVPELNAQNRDATARVKLLAFGDVNLGRAVGQELLKGNLDYPFCRVKDTLASADIVFANLESQLSDQNGETQSPKYNLIFCGPPEGALVLRDAGISIVSTANNHAYDYKMKALDETVESLQKARVAFVGTSIDSLDCSEPAIIEKNGVLIGFLAYTRFLNFAGAWGGHIALFEEARVARDIAALRPRVDIVIVSYHGGAEYVDKPSSQVRRDLRLLVDAGADVVLGHHPHYAQGIEVYRGSLLLYSLGNFVFYQPQKQWTQFGLGVEMSFERRTSKVELVSARLLPLRAGLQPSFVLSVEEQQSFFERLKKLSSVPVVDHDGMWFIKTQ